MSKNNGKKAYSEDIEKILEDGYGENGDRLNVAKVRPVTAYRTAELVICFIAVIVGVIYLKTSLLTLNVVMPLYSLFFVCIPVLRWLDNRKCGIKGAAAWIVNLAWAVMAGAVLAATIVYFVRY